MVPKTKTEAISTAREKAIAYVRETGSCAYSTVRAIQETFDLNDEAMLKASGAITGGIGGMADACGSMIGSCLMVGSVCGAGRNEGLDLIDKLHYVMDKARDFYNWFRQQKGSVRCNDILTVNAGGVHYDFTDRAQIIKAIEAGVLAKCDTVVGNNAAKAAEMMWEEMHRKRGKRRNPKF